MQNPHELAEKACTGFNNREKINISKSLSLNK